MGTFPTDEQRQIIEHQSGAILVMAPAGTGKTRTMASRLARALKEGVDPKRCLCLTFTNRAAAEMRKRVEAEVELATRAGIQIRTFHSLCAYVLRREAVHLGIPRDFVIYDEEDCAELLRHSLVKLLWVLESVDREQALPEPHEFLEGQVFDETFRLRVRRLKLRSPLRLIALRLAKLAHRMCVTIGQIKSNTNREHLFLDSLPAQEIAGEQLYAFILEATSDVLREEVRARRGSGYSLFLDEWKNAANLVQEYIWTDYHRLLHAHCAMDFADLVYRVRTVLHKFPERAESWAEQYAWVQVDEVQDTHGSEYDVLRCLSKKSRTVALFGDIDQTIYEWRGSNPYSLLERFVHDFEPVTEFGITVNQRSTKTLVRVANEVAAMLQVRRTKLTPAADLPVGEPVVCRRFTSREAEAGWIGQQLKQGQEEFPNCGSTAVLVRTNARASEISAALSGIGVPHVTVEQYQFFRRQEVKDALGWLRLLLNPHDGGAAHRVISRPPRGIGVATIRGLHEAGQPVHLRLVDFLRTDTHRYGDPFGGLLQAAGDRNLVLLDIESTGYSWAEDEPVEIAAVRRCEGNVVLFHRYIKPDKPVGESEQIHGLNDSFLNEHGVHAADALRELAAFVRGGHVIGHNIRFDLSLLQRVCAKNGLSLSLTGIDDTLEIARRVVPNAARFDLHSLCEALRLPQQPSHRADQDVNATAHLLKALLPRLVNTREARAALVEKYSHLFRPLAGVMTRLREAMASLRPPELLELAFGLTGLRKNYEHEPRRLESLSRLHQIVLERDDKHLEPVSALRQIVEFAATARNIDHLGLDEQLPMVITVHQAKGLEFDNVYVASAYDDEFPNYRAVKEGRWDEECRLFYVAVTRARRRLFVTMHPGRRGTGQFFNVVHRAAMPEEVAEVGESTTAANVSAYDRINDYGAVRILLASSHDIRSWSFGEVKKPEMINYRTYRPEYDGLFCERIFGPQTDWECTCGKYRGMDFKGMICDRCGVKVTHSRVRRERMGHIELAAPVVHIWLFKATPNRVGTLLNMATSGLERIIYFQDYVVIDPGDTPLRERQLLSEEECRKAKAEYGEASFEADMGAEAIKKLLQRTDLVSLSLWLRQELANANSLERQKELIKRLKLVEALRDSDNKPEWMVLDCIPVIPPDLRPLVLLDSGNFATSDLNDLYRRIINQNNRLKKLVDLKAPEVIIRNEKRMLQQSVDALFDNNRCKRPVLGSSNRLLKSLTDMIKGTQGRFRENLLGKRVDYSARSVIVVGPELRLHQCGLPKKIALELFQPFIIGQLKELGRADTIKSAKKMLERKEEQVWDILEDVIQNHPVLLNRAPTLHRMGIQAFEPVLVEGNAIKIHPLVCKGFNADFDGDQMAVHLPLSIEAQVEAATLMMATNNIFSPANGNPIISPSQDIVMGCYYTTVPREDQLGKGTCFSSAQEVFLAYAERKVAIHARVKVRLRVEKRVKGEGASTYKPGGLIETTVGRVLFNDILPPQMPFYNNTLSSGQLNEIIADCYQTLGRRETIDLLDRMKNMGFKQATLSGLSFATSDLRTPATKTRIIAHADKEVERINRLYQKGIITERERYNQVLEAWTHARDQITGEMMQELQHDVRDGKEYLNPIFLMAHSGVGASVDQIRHLAGMRGLMAKPSGKIIETPIKASLREGLSMPEYFSSTRAARRVLADTTFKTVFSRRLLRTLADVAQNVVVTMYDCGTVQGVTKGAVYRGEKIEVSLAKSIRGRVSRSNIANPITDEVIVGENELITREKARKIEELGIDKIQVRSGMTCEAPLGVCQLCYGMDLATGQLVEEGMAVGIIAAQSIGEPGTQLTMRTFHIGGTASRSVEESKITAKKSGKVRLLRVNVVVTAEGHRICLTRNGDLILVDAKEREVEKFTVPNGAQLMVEEGQQVEGGSLLCQWDPHMIPILAEVGGRIRFEDIQEGETLRTERDPGGSMRRFIMEHKGDLHPQIIVEDQSGKILDFYYIPEKAHIEVEETQQISAGTLLAKTPREVAGTQDITGGLPRVTEIFEARRPKEPAVIAEIDGQIELVAEKTRGKRKIIVKPAAAAGQPKEHLVPHGKHLRVHGGDFIKAGDALVEGPLVPHDILRISGEEAVQVYLLREIQSVYRSQSVDIDDKHVEIIIAQMLRKVRVRDGGDTKLLPESVIDKFQFRQRNQELAHCVKVSDPGDTDYHAGAIVPRDVFDQENARIDAAGGKTAKWTKPTPANAAAQLLGITAAALQTDSFISAASFGRTRKVLIDAALAGKVDRLVGLKENVILGHVVPAGTGFKAHQEAEVRVRPELLEGVAMEQRSHWANTVVAELLRALLPGAGGSAVGG